MTICRASCQLSVLSCQFHRRDLLCQILAAGAQHSADLVRKHFSLIAFRLVAKMKLASKDHLCLQLAVTPVCQFHELAEVPLCASRRSFRYVACDRYGRTAHLRCESINFFFRETSCEFVDEYRKFD